MKIKINKKLEKQNTRTQYQNFFFEMNGRWNGSERVRTHCVFARGSHTRCEQQQRYGSMNSSTNASMNSKSNTENCETLWGFVYSSDSLLAPFSGTACVSSTTGYCAESFVSFKMLCRTNLPDCGGGPAGATGEGKAREKRRSAKERRRSAKEREGARQDRGECVCVT